MAARRRRERNRNPSALSSSPVPALEGGHRSRNHPDARTASPLPCSAPTGRQLQAGSYSGHTPPLRGFKHPDDLVPGTGNRSGPRSGSQVSDGRPPPVTSLEGVTPRVPRRMSRLPPGHSFRRPHDGPAISGARRQKLPLTLGADCSRFGTVSGRHSPASPCGPLVVELFAVPGLSRGSPGLVHGPVPPVARSGAPHAGRVERTCRKQARTPRRGFSPLRPSRPRPEGRGLSLSPTFLPAARTSRREATKAGERPTSLPPARSIESNAGIAPRGPGRLCGTTRPCGITPASLRRTG